MNKIHKALFSLFGFFVGHEAHAATPCTPFAGTPAPAQITGTIQHTLGAGGCTGTTTSYYQTSTNTYVEVINCTGSCKSDYKKDIQTTTVGGCYIDVTGCTICNPCTNCSSTSWTTPTNGLQSRTTATCVDKCTNTCSRSTDYRCVAGYYGSPTSTNPACYVCPTSGGLTGTSALGSNATINRCYFPAGTPVDDTTGTYEFTSSCFYGS